MAKLDLTKGLTPSEYKRVRIGITSAYKWGSGWTSADEHEFEMAIYPKLENAGYYMRNSSVYSSCPTLYKSGSSISLYMHPMEFVGYATEKEIKEVADILDASEVCIVNSITTSPVYKLSDEEYTDLLAKHSKDIIELIKKEYGNISKHYIGMEFAEKNRVPRVGDSSGLCSSDIDVVFINHLCKIANALGL